MKMLRVHTLALRTHDGGDHDIGKLIRALESGLRLARLAVNT